LESSGFNLVVSDAPGTDFAAQVDDATAFLIAHRKELARLMEAPGVEDVVLDFGIKRLDMAVQSVTFPAQLIRLAGDLGLAIELSQYPLGE
jgi:hypothetical protein